MPTNFVKTTYLWDHKDLDASDLAVVLAHDICEQRINVFDYLKYADDLDRLTGVRFCLLTGSKPDTDFPVTLPELEHIFVSNLIEKFPFIKTTDHALIRAFLITVQYPLGQWRNCLHVEHCSLPAVQSYTELEELKQALCEHLSFNTYQPCRLESLPAYDWRL